MATFTQHVPITGLGFDSAYLATFEDKLFIEGAQTRRRMINFFTLLLLATVIATYGVLSNSTATVIGAMIVAPLMGPIMATTAAVVMGSLPRALRGLILTTVGIAAVILFSYLLAWIIPQMTISFANNGEIASRINPGLYALLTALGAGAAGAFIISRAEISDSMGGVAIAISLVPPLCVVGISLRMGETEAAAGAFLLFMTNFLAILLAGGVVFLILGLGKQAIHKEQARVRQRGLILFVVGTLLVSIPLSLSTYQNIIHVNENNRASGLVQNWLEGTFYRMLTVDVSGQDVTVDIEGTGEEKPLGLLAEDLSAELKRPVIVKLRIIPAQVSQPGSP